MDTVTSTGSGNWVQFTTQWATNGSTEVTIVLKDNTVLYNGDDFVIDDISMVVESKTVDLLAGQTTDVGDVIVTPLGGGSFDVCYTTVYPWVLTELHLDAGCSFAEINTNKACNPQIGLFDVSLEGFELNSYEECVTVTPGCDCGVFFAAHAVVKNIETDVTETAWGQGSGFVCDDREGKSWAMYFQYP